MKLAGKFLAFIIGVFLLLIAVDGWWLVRRDIRHFNRQTRREARILGHAMQYLLADVWAESGRERALQLIRDVNRGEKEIRIRWVWLDDAAPEQRLPSVPVQQVRKLLARPNSTGHVQDSKSSDFVYTYVSVAVPSERDGAIELAVPTAPMQQVVNRTIMRGIILAGTAALLGVIAMLALGYTMIGHPLHRITGKIRRIAGGELKPPLDMTRHDEIGEVAQGLNRMCEELAATRKKATEEAEARIAAVKRLQQKDRLETIGSLASGIAHELGTPLNVVLGRAGLILHGTLPPEQIAECATIICGQCERMTAIIKRLLDFARHKPAAKQRIDVCQTVDRTLELLRPLAGRKGVTLVFAEKPPDGKATAPADPAQLEQVLTNLVMNAVHASEDENATVEISVVRQDAVPPDSDDARTERSMIRIDVRDHGAGILPQDREHLFEPFFSTKTADEGTGLGLAIVNEIIEDHNGWITVNSTPGEGATFFVFIPEEKSNGYPHSHCRR